MGVCGLQAMRVNSVLPSKVVIPVPVRLWWENGNLFKWIPAFAGMTPFVINV